MESSIRTETAHRLRLAVVAAGLPVASIYGSWAFGDFHLDETHMHTFSDLDLLCPIEAGLEAKLSYLKSTLDSLIEIDISVRTHDDLGADIGTLSDRWITMVGFAYAYSADFRRPLSPQQRCYLEAKAALMLLRSRRSLRYAQIAKEIADVAAMNALHLKLGQTNRWLDEHHLTSLLDRVQEPFLSLCHNMIARGSMSAADLTILRDGLVESARAMPMTLFQHTSAKLKRLEARLSVD